MFHEIFLKIFYGMCFFLFNTWFFDIELCDILYSISCKLYILWIGVLDWHRHCVRVWCEIIKIVEHSLDFHLGSCKPFDEVENVSGIFFYWYRILFWNFEICTISIFWKDVFIISPVSEGSGDVMVLRRSHPPPAARNGVNAITQKPRDGLFSNLVYTLVVIVSWPD